MSEVRAILLDIEGTTTPIAFVYEVLFPYARRRVEQYVQQHASSPDHRALFDRLRQEYEADDEPVASIVGYLEWLMDRDRKSTALKALQGLIWEEGYRSGDLTGEVFADVPAALERWHARGLPVGIFSSGSVLAQQLLFRHSSAGDLTPRLQWHFDTTTGAKTDPESYRRIADAMELPAETVLFVSDVAPELDAARSAGMQTRLAIRPGNKPAPARHDHAELRTFDDVR